MSDQSDDAGLILKRGEPKQIRAAMEAALKARGMRGLSESNERRVTNMLRAAPMAVLLKEALRRIQLDKRRARNRERMQERRANRRPSQGVY